MSEHRWPGDDPLDGDDVLTQAIEDLPEAGPARDLWPGISMRLHTPARPRLSVTWAQLALAASLLMAVSSGVTWLVARQSMTSAGIEPTVRAEGESTSAPDAGIAQANFADAQYDAAVVDLERVLREDRTRLDPRTVIVIERNLQAIDEAIQQARSALDSDPANPYLNSHLADSRRRKLELLRRAAQLASTGGD